MRIRATFMAVLAAAIALPATAAKADIPPPVRATNPDFTADLDR